MSGWGTVRLGDVLSIRNGFAFNSKQFGDEGKPLIRIRDLKKGSLTKTRFSGKFDPIYIVKSGDLLVGMDGEFRCHRWRGEDALLNQRVCRLENFSNNVNPEFVEYGLNRFLSDIEERTTFTTVKHLSAKDILAIEFPLPPLDEQKRIVAKLDAMLATIESAVTTLQASNLLVQDMVLRSLRSVFDQQCQEAPWTRQRANISEYSERTTQVGCNVGGRPETERVIERRFSLAVGGQRRLPRQGWRWVKMTDVACLESGHTPSRGHEEYWGGDISWLSIGDARNSHGFTVNETQQRTNSLGIANSAARVLPIGTVCLSRTASVGYVVVLGAPMATSQDFINWACGEELEPEFLKYLLLAEGRDFSDLSSGSIHQTIYVPEAKAFYVCIPDVETQLRIVSYLDEVLKLKGLLVDLNQCKSEGLLKLRKSIFEELLQRGGLAA